MSRWIELFYYDPTSVSGLRYKSEVRSGMGHQIVSLPAGTAAGWESTGGYYMLTCQGKALMVHRVIWELCTGDLLGKDEIDHIDGNPKNNVFSNLRRVSHSLNTKNRRKRVDNKTGYVGVSKQSSGKGRWYVVAQVSFQGKVIRQRWSLSNHKEPEAILLAAKWRESKRTELLADGYTERHLDGYA